MALAFRQLLSQGLTAFRKLAAIRARIAGTTPAEIAERRVTEGRSWEEFCDALKAAGAVLSFPGAPSDPLNQAEGTRYLARLARAALETFVENADPAAPQLQRVVHETVKMGSDNPDNLYHNAPIAPERRYRLIGSRGTVHYLGFFTQAGSYGRGAGMSPTGRLDARELELDDAGDFEIVVSRERSGVNWLPMTEATGTLIVRQTFLDRARETPAALRLELLEGPATPAALRAADLDAALRQSGDFVLGASLLFAKWARDFQASTNELPLFDEATSTAFGGDPQIAYYHSYWRLGPQQALLVEVTPPICENWNFQLNNHWMESLDYRYFRIHLNKMSARCNAEGMVRIVVAHRDPGQPNWISTAGHHCGTMTLRWIRAESRPQPKTRVVRLDEWLREIGANDER